MKRLLAAFWIALAAGCVHVPFQEAGLVPLQDRDPGSVVESFRAGSPVSFQLLNTVVFEYNSRKFSGIGSLEVDGMAQTFKLAAMNPMGVKLLELSGDRQRITTVYAMPALNRYGDLGTTVGNDIRRMYFDLIPGPEAVLWKRKYKLLFRQPSGQGFLEYVFAGERGDLIEKNYYEDQGIVWRVSYYEYHAESGRRVPRGIVFIHYDHRYRLTVRNKEFRFEDNKS